MTEQEAWQFATRKVGDGLTDICLVYVCDGEYMNSFKPGAVRVGFISRSRDGRYWQALEADDSRHELDPKKGLMDFVYR